MIIDNADLVVACPIDVVLREKELRVLYQKIANTAVPVGENQAAGPTLVREVQAVIIVAVGLAVEEKQTLVVKSAASVVVNEIEDDGNAVEMEQIDQCLELVRTRSELLDCDRRHVSLGQQQIDLAEISAEFGVVFDLVCHFRREEVGIVVSQTVVVGEFLDRQQLHGSHSELSEVWDTRQYIQELRNLFPLVAATRVHSVERANVQLINDVLVEWHRPKFRVMPWIGTGSPNEAIAIRKWRIRSELAGPGIPLEAGAGFADHIKPVRRALGQIGNKTGPGAVVSPEQPVGFARHPACMSRGRQIAGNHVDINRSRRPCSKGGASFNKVHPHWSRVVDMSLSSMKQSLSFTRGHVGPPYCGFVLRRTSILWSGSKNTKTQRAQRHKEGRLK